MRPVAEVSLSDAGEMYNLHSRQRAKMASDTLLPDFDLHEVEEALMASHTIFGGDPMTMEGVKEAMCQYRQFLRSHKIAGMPEVANVPSRLIDRVWHTHMCETKQYAQNCQEYFGQFIHHSFGTCEGWGR